MIRCLVVDDEPLARQRVRDLLSPHSDFEIAGECETGDEAVVAIDEQRPDVVFLDIQMPGLDAFTVLRDMPQPRPMIVFTTAYAEHAVRAFDEHAVDYLLKPLDARRFDESVNRVRDSLAQPPPDWPARVAALVEKLEQRDQLLKRIAVRDSGRIRFVETRDVEWFEAQGNYVRLHLNGNGYLVRMTLQSLEQRLDPHAFARIHRSIIINVQRIDEIQPRWRGDSTILLKSGAEVTMQRRYRQRLNAAIGDL